MKRKNENLKTNLAGVIPVSGYEDKLGTVLPDSCFSLNKDYTAIERSVIECAYAGCNTIWIVCNDTFAPIIKKIIGDYIIDPASYESQNFVKYQKQQIKYIPVFYTPVHPKDRDKRDSLGWSALYGALVSYSISHKISGWIAPKKYFISFPFGIYNPLLAKENRKSINSLTENFYFSFEDQTVREGRYLGFTLFPEEWKIIKTSLKNSCSGGSRNLPLAERWSSKDFTLDKIYNNDIIVVDKKSEVEIYHDLETWESIKNYFATPLLQKQHKIVCGLKHERKYYER